MGFLRRRWRGAETGQALVLIALMLPVLLGAAGLAIDFGRLAAQRRELQTNADAAALAGGQDLSLYASQAVTDAQSSLSSNGYGSSANDTAAAISVFQTTFPNDTISVALKRKVSLDFMPVLGIGSQNVSAKATAVVASLAGCEDTGSALCAPYAVWRPGPACPGIQSEFENGLVVIFRDNGWVGDTGAGGCPAQWTIPSNDFKGFLRPLGGAIVTGNDTITTHGGNACGQEPWQNIQNAWTDGQKIVIPIIDLGTAGQGNGNPSITIPGFITLQLHFTYPYTNQIQSVTINGLPTGGNFTLSFGGQTTPASNAATQTVTVYGVPTGGNFTLGYAGQTTAPIAYPATASAVQNALTTMTPGLVGNVSVSGPVGGPYAITFGGTLNLTQLSPIRADASGLTGGTNTWIGITGIALPYNATASDVRAALGSLSSVTGGVANVDVGGASVGQAAAFLAGGAQVSATPAPVANPDGSFTVWFSDPLAIGQGLQPMTSNATNLTGGSNTSVVITVTSTNTSKSGSQTLAGDYSCPATWWGEVVPNDPGTGTVGGLAGGTAQPCDTTFFTCTIRLQ